MSPPATPQPYFLPSYPLVTFAGGASVPNRPNSPSVLDLASQEDNYRAVVYKTKLAPRWTDLYRRLLRMDDPSLSVATVLDRWEEEQRQLSKWELCRVANQLRKIRYYKLALDVYDWLTARGERFRFYASDAAILLDLICKVRGISFAEDYFSGLSEDLKDKRTHCALLNACAYTKNKHKAEAVFETMIKNGYATDPYGYNIMMTLYMNIGEHEKVIALINEMKMKDIRLGTVSYNIWIHTCAALGDVDEVDRVLELMNKDPGVNATWATCTILATMHTRLGNVDKAERYIRDAESRMTHQDRTSCDYLISLYSLVGKKEEVYRVWERYKSSFREILNSGYRRMISALIKLNDIDGAERLYNEWLTSTTMYDPENSNLLISYYVNQGSVEEAESCLECLVDQGGAPNPKTWELLAKGNIAKKQTSKALSCLQAASVVKPFGRKWTPRPSIVKDFLVVCGEQNDQAGVESLVEVLKKVKCLREQSL